VSVRTQAQVDQVQPLLVGGLGLPQQEVFRFHISVHIPAKERPFRSAEGVAAPAILYMAFPSHWWRTRHTAAQWRLNC